MKKGKVIPIIIGVVVVAIVAVSAIFFIPKLGGVNLKNFVADELEYSGLNGYGYAYDEDKDVIDYKKLLEALSDRSFDAVEQSMNIFEEDSFYNAFYVENLTESQNLKNGDVIELEISVDKDIINNLTFVKHQIKGDVRFKKKYKVSGLAEPTYIDPFEFIKGIYNAESAFSVNNFYLNYKTDYELEYPQGKFVAKCSKYNNIVEIVDSKNFEKTVFKMVASNPSFDKENYVVTVSFADGNDLVPQSCDELGIIFTSVEKEYKVTPTKKVKDKSQVTDKALNELQERGLNELNRDSNKYILKDSYFEFWDRSPFVNTYTNVEYNVIITYESSTDAVAFVYECLVMDNENNIINTGSCNMKRLDFKNMAEFEKYNLGPNAESQLTKIG